jgi:hypothetical protein
METSAARVRLRSDPGTPRSLAVARETLLPARDGVKRRQPLTSLFSPHLDKIPTRHYCSAPGQPGGGAQFFADNAGAVARLVLEAYRGDPRAVERAAALARRATEMLEFELRSPHADRFADAAGTGQVAHLRKMLSEVSGTAAQRALLDARHSVTGYTALHAACDFGQLSAARMLLEAGADPLVERAADLGHCLQCAAENGHVQVVRFLAIERGVDKLHKNKYGLTAFDYAELNAHREVADILREPPSRITGVTAGAKGRKLTSRAVELSWSVPDDMGVEIQEYEVSFVAVGGTEIAVFPERQGLVCRRIVPAALFGINPFRRRRDAELRARAEGKARGEAAALRRAARTERRARRAARLAAARERGEKPGTIEIDPDDETDEEDDSDEDDETAERNRAAAVAAAVVAAAGGAGSAGASKAPADRISSAGNGSSRSRSSSNNNSNTSNNNNHDNSNNSDSKALPSDGSLAWHLFDDILWPFTTYAVTVRARNAAGWSQPSERTTFATLADVPDAPGRARAAATGATCATLDLEWPKPFSNNGRPVVSYELEVLLLPPLAPEDEPWAPAAPPDAPPEEEARAAARRNAAQAAREAAARLLVPPGYEWALAYEHVPGSAETLVNLASGNVREVREFDPAPFTCERLLPGSRYRVRARARNECGQGAWSEPSDVLRTRPAALLRGPPGAKHLDVDWRASVDPATQAKGILRWEVQRTELPVLPGGKKLDTGTPYDWRTTEWVLVSDQVPGATRCLAVCGLQAASAYYVRVRPHFREPRRYAPPAWSGCAVSLALWTAGAPPEEPQPPFTRRAAFHDETDAWRLDVTHCSIKVRWLVPRGNGSRVSAFALRMSKAAIGTWQAVGPGEIPRLAEELELRIAADEAAEGGAALSSGARFVERVVPGLDPGTAYKFAVRACTAAGWGAFSAPSAMVRTRSAPPPGAPRASQRTDSMIRLEWEAGGIAAVAQAQGGAQLSFEVEVRMIESESRDAKGVEGHEGHEPPPRPTWHKALPTAIATVNEIQVSELLPVTNYEFRVRARAGPQGEWTNFSRAGGPYKTQRKF